jgi:hypothetical protein
MRPPPPTIPSIRPARKAKKQSRGKTNSVAIAGKNTAFVF